MSESFRRRLHRFVVRAAICCAMLCAAVARGEDGQESEQHTATLQRHGISADTAGLIGYLHSLSPDAQRETQIARLVEQLGDAQFDTREAAAQKLQTMGDSARPALVAAKNSPDAEVAWRAEQLLRQLESGRQAEANRGLLLAVLMLLKQRRSPDAVAPLLATLPLCDEPHLADAASEALWASVDRSHGETLQSALRSPNANVAAAAIVALEAAIGDEATEMIAPFLTSDNAYLRLAAARALVDRRPLEVASVLVDVSLADDADLATQAESLLAALSSKAIGEVDWRKWHDTELARAKLNQLGDARRDLSLGRGRLHETFANGIGRMEYESSIGRALRVTGGVAAIGGGEQPEGDQRLFITAQRLTGRPEFSGNWQVRTRLASEVGNNFGWHLGVSIGGVKVLFHPGVDGGAFRIETVDAHEYLIQNLDMGFTPRPGAVYEMTVDVQPNRKGAKLTVLVVDDDNPKNRFSYAYQATAAQLGKLNRIGLERSGRTGGAALFDDVTIRRQ